MALTAQYDYKFALVSNSIKNMIRAKQSIFARAFARYASTSSKSGPTAVVLMNMGGPSTVEGTRDFLYRLFSDGDLIPFGRFQKPLAKFITARRYKTIEEHYKEIGGGSPIRKFSEQQGEMACELLDKLNPDTAPHKSYVAFRYAPPLTDEMYEQLLKDGVKRAIAFSQYPQYSFSTTRSSVNELERVIERMDPERTIEWSYILRWPTHPSFIKTVARKVQQEIEKFPEADQKDVMVLFSAHSLPMTIVNKGDPYVAEVSASAYAVMQSLGFSNPYRCTYQSQVGPQPWLGAQTQKAIQTLEKQPGYKGVVVVPIAFTTDHIETLHEIDIEMREEVTKPELLRRAESLNLDAGYIQAMAEIVKEHLNDDDAAQVASGAAARPVFNVLN